MQRLSEFIRSHEDELVSEWERFARSLPGGADETVDVLRDHAREMLEVIADDLDRPQTAEQQHAKSLGQADASAYEKTATAAQQHGAGRAERGFTFGQMVSEFRALRASVLRRWTEYRKGVGPVGPELLDDITRFNEAIDQAIAESVQQYTQDVDSARQRFIGILGHDLITPIGAITTAARFMQDSPDLPEQHRALIGSIESSATRMNRMASDLLDFARTSLGESIPITRRSMELREAVETAIAEIKASRPGSMIDFESSGDSRGEWDYDRLVQATGNLVGNALQHGEPERISVKVDGRPGEVVLSVNNPGPVIPEELIPELFKAGTQGMAVKGRQHLGLGLYIVDQIVRAHGGNIAVTSTEKDGTTFAVHLPRLQGADVDAPEPGDKTGLR